MATEEIELRSYLVRSAIERTRFGCKRALAIVRRPGFNVNRKRVQRI